MRKPVLTNCGHTFDEDSINRHLEKNTQCPNCRQEVNNLTQNYALKAAIDKFQTTN